jgi:sugar phosphate isomerase/epimerase
MSLLKLAVVLESLGRPVREALDIAATLGVTGVQVDAAGPLAPSQLTQTGRREFRHLLRARGLELVALGCPLRHGFDHAEGLEARVELVRQTLSLAYDLGPRVVIAYGGPLDLDEKHPAFPFLHDSLTDLARHGDRVGATLALETGVEALETVPLLLARFDSAGLGLNLDPASLLLHRHDPLTAVRAWKERIVHVHARDARPGRPDRGAIEVPLGAGDVDWIAFLGALEEVGYRGALTIKRGPTADPRGELLAGVRFLRRLIG